MPITARHRARLIDVRGYRAKGMLPSIVGTALATRGQLSREQAMVYKTPASIHRGRAMKAEEARRAFVALVKKLRPIRLGQTDIPADALARMQEAAQGKVYLEYGSGASTLAMAPYASEIISVDSDRRFLRAVVAGASPEHRARIHPIFVDIGLTGTFGWPVFRGNEPDRIDRWKSYPTAPWEFMAAKGTLPDVVLVDGRFRVASVLETIARVASKTGVLLFLDNFGSRRAAFGAILPFIEPIEEYGGSTLCFRPRGGIDVEELRRVRDRHITDPR